MLYRLAASPGRPSAARACRRAAGAIVRPLLDLERAELRAPRHRGGPALRDDETNADPAFARNRIRTEVLPVLREIEPDAAERTSPRPRPSSPRRPTLLERVVREALEAAGAGAGAVAIRAEALAGSSRRSGAWRCARLAERAAGRAVPLGRRRAAQIWRLVDEPEGGVVELGGGVRRDLRAGACPLRDRDGGRRRAGGGSASSARGAAASGSWEVRAELRAGPLAPAGPDLATLDAGGARRRAGRSAPGARATGCGRSGSDGSKSPAGPLHRPRRPALAASRASGGDRGGRIVWVAGVAVSEEFRLGPEAHEVAALTARVLD